MFVVDNRISPWHRCLAIIERGGDYRRMPNIKSAIKRARQNEKRRLRNKALRTRVKTEMKRVLMAIEEGREEQEIKALLHNTLKTIDKVGSKGVFHKRTVARKKSRFTRHVNAALSTRR